MENNFSSLYKKYKAIENLGWIKTKRSGTSGIGYTFECLIGKVEENFPIPDFQGIEIKTSRHNSWGKIHLFHATPDGDYLFPIKDILEKLGYPDKDFPEYKVFNYSINAKEYTNIGFGKKAKILIDKDKEKVYLLAKNKLNQNIDLHTSWSFKMLEERLDLKLKHLAIVKAQSKKENKTEYFKYDKIYFYKLKDFNTLIKLIECGKINITFMIGLHKSGKRFGQTHDRGTAFTIYEKDINLLYDRFIL